MPNENSITALMSAFVRAWHTENAVNPVFRDPIARNLFSANEYAQMKAYILSGADFFAGERKLDFRTDESLLQWIINTQLAPTPLARARFCEDSLRTAVATGTEQYVILGAGYDTFAWRETRLMQKLAVFEVDQAATQKDKVSRLLRAGLEQPNHLHMVAADLSQGHLLEAMKAKGFDPNKKTFFSLLGVSFYLNQEDLVSLADELSRFAAEGSSLLMDFGDEHLLNAEDRPTRNMLAMAAAGGEPMHFAMAPLLLEQLLSESHFLVYELLDEDEIGGRYFAGRKDHLAAFPHICLMNAVLKGTPLINTREKILRAALELFSSGGFQAVSVRDIAGRLNITQAALYKHFKNKQDIFDSIVARMEEEELRRDQLAALRSVEKKTVSNRIREYLQEQFDYWTQDEIASAFRRMLTIEQYRDIQMAKLYAHYFTAGPLAHLEKMLADNPGEASDPQRLALNLYSPIYLLYQLYDSAEDKDAVLLRLREKIKAL